MLSTKFIKDLAPSVYKLEKRFGLVEKNFGLPSFDPREKGLLALKKTIVGYRTRDLFRVLYPLPRFNYYPFIDERILIFTEGLVININYLNFYILMKSLRPT